MRESLYRILKGGFAGAALIVASAVSADVVGTGSVIFMHPDGASAASWAAARALLVGPDKDLEWDRIPQIALYRGHMKDSLTATSNGGATTHAYGVKVYSDAYGRTAADERGEEIVDAEGRSLSVARQAIAAGIRVGVVQTGTNTEPGTGCFLASVERRGDHEEIAAQLIESGADVILGGGERYFLPDGVQGAHGAGVRTDGRNLIQEARDSGYRVVRTRDELKRLPTGAERVLGLFASYHTFNALPEETLEAEGLPQYNPEAPSVAEMTQAAIDVLDRDGDRYFLIVEEEGTDNFGNRNNASGMFEAMRRADEAFGVARRHVAANPATLLITAADSDAGGMRLIGIPVETGEPIPEALPARDRNGAPIDGVNGTGSAPFVAKPDRFGQRLPFFVTWAANDDVSGGILVRAEGLNSGLVRGSMDNTEITDLIRLTLFGIQPTRRAE